MTTVRDVRVRLVSIVNPTLSTTHGPSVPTRDHVFVAVRDGDGRVGVGEGSPLPRFTGERAGDMVTILRDVFAPLVVGSSPFDIERLTGAFDRALPQHSASKSALVNALFDLQGAIVEQPLGVLLGGRVRDEVQTAGVVGIASISDMVQQAEDFVAAGFGTVKLKIGREVDHDVLAVRAVRAAVGDRVEVRVDANGGYSYGEAVRFGLGVEDARVQYLEQPLPRGDTRGSARLRQRISTPIAVDESLHGVRDALELYRQDAADVFVIKMIKCGGLHQARKVVTIAEAAGIACVAVSPYETSFGAACNVHLAASSTAFRFASEIGPGVSEVAFEGAEELDYVDGTVIVPRANGVGVGLPGWVFDETGST